MENKYYNIGIFILVLLYIVINFLYKKFTNIIIFTLLFSIINYIVKDYLTALVISYVVSIVYGIYKNFHLLENFEEDTEIDIKQDSNLVTKPLKKQQNKVNQINNSNKVNNNLKKQKKIELKNINMKELITDALLEKFLEYLKTNYVSIINNKKINIYSLKPTITNLNSNKIKNMTRTDKEDKPIVISKDNFIVDGHHRWYSQKIKIDGYTTTNLKNHTNISVVLIDLPINDIIKKIEDFKSNYNNREINNFNIDKKRVNEAKDCILNIKNNINKLEQYYTDFNEIKLL